jgi:tetratricopeptide (TPR) repeat protein
MPHDNGVERAGLSEVAEVSAEASAPDDPRVIAAVREYVALMEAGQRLGLSEFLGRYPDIAGVLGECLEGLAFVQAVAPELSGPVAEGGGIAGAGEAPLTGTLGDFRLLREIGRGGMGVVYEAEQISLGRRVAVKVLPFAATMDPRHLQRFHNEARAAASLHHEHIVPVYAVGCERAVHFYAMQLIEGESLADLLAARGRTSARQQGVDATRAQASATTPAAPHDPARHRRIAGWGIQAAEALEHAHSLGIVHRDVKPANLIVDGAGKLWVTDFGLARTATDAGLTMTGDLLGTLRYMSPEQALAKHGLVDHRTDVYSLGATLYELLAGRPAVEGQDRQEILKRIADEEPRPPRALDGAVPADLETVVLKALAREPAERYATAQELADDLHRFLTNRPILARRPSAVQLAARWVRRHQAAVLSAGAVLALAAFALAISAALIWLEKERTARALREKTDALARAEQQQHRAEGDFAKALNVLPTGLEKLCAEEGADSPQSVHAREVLIAHMEEYFRHFLEERPDDRVVRLETAWAYNHLGCYHWSHGHLARALRAHQTAVSIMDERAAQFPTNVDYINVRGDSYWRLAAALHRVGKCREGRDAFRACLECQRRCVELEPTNWHLLDALATTLTVCPYEELRDPEQALSLARRAQSVVPTGETSLDELGRAYYRAGNLEMALAALEKAIPFKGEHLVVINFSLVPVHVKRGESEKARRIYDEESERLRERFARSGRLRTDAWGEIVWAEAAASLGLDDPAPVPPLE